ncbi:MAG: hypothetical protein NTW76_01300 [Corynebacteriales bacterium]|uniref:WXG100 family type VII secretion target n=1 Tax=Williamsia herbipolensis TaxID=1603258 RepID=A0AAU4K0E0_9NOCA|nr:hypothetical protein [Williamsia herbipolensis]MCX6467941.1 hypothetical protein [Mycobacteriales bacterium]
MSTDPLSTDIAGLRAAARRFADAADEVQAALDKVSAEVDGRDASVWGGDEPGGVFGEGYEPAHQDAMATLRDIHQRLSAAAVGVAESARIISDQDDANATSFGESGS